MSLKRHTGYSDNGNSHLGRCPALTSLRGWRELRLFIDDNSGVGIQFVAEDMNKDGRLDFVVGNKNGVFYFEQLPPGK